MTLDFH